MYLAVIVRTVEFGCESLKTCHRLLKPRIQTQVNVFTTPHQWPTGNYPESNYSVKFSGVLSEI